jgi:hypothetical protein
MYIIKTFNQISVKGLERFSREKYEVGSDIGHLNTVLLRSHKLHNAPLADSVLAMARAGNGTCDECSRSYSGLSIEAAWRVSSDVQKAENMYALLTARPL